MSTQNQNTPKQKGSRPLRARLRAKATAEVVQSQHTTTQHYTRADVLKQSNIWFRKQGAPSSFLHVNVLSTRSHAPYPGSYGRASCTSAISSCAISLFS